MNEPKSQRQDDVVDRAVQALRATPVPEDAPPEVLERLAAACPGEPGQVEGKSLMQRISTMPRYTKAAAAVLLIAAAGLVVFLAVGPGATTVSWADVQRKIQQARTLTFTATMEQEGVPPMKIKAMVKGSVTRQEMSEPHEMVLILDSVKQQVLTLVPSDKEAMLANLAGLPEATRKSLDDKDVARALKKLIDEEGVAAGEKTLAGRKALGYQVGKGEQTQLTIWADAGTGDPLVLELLQYGGRVKVTLRDFQVDKPLDDSLFSLKPPEGYNLTRLDIKSATAEDMVTFLKLWVDARGDSFPETLSEVEWFRDCAAAMEQLQRKLSREQQKELAASLARARLFLQLHLDRFGYAGAGVKKGDAKVVVFWFQPQGKETYTVIYGDLRVKEGVAATDLPKPPATKPSATRPSPAK
jgi:outer membrane lipoprotein-sorting protein